MSTTTTKPKRLTVPIGAAAARIEWGPLTPGVASVWINQTGARVSVHATPAQLRELAALCVHAADEIEAEMEPETPD